MFRNLLTWVARISDRKVLEKRSEGRWSRRRPMRFEPLEDRRMLAVTGDFNMSGIVDEADYALWKSEFGNTSSPADGNGDGIVDAADYTMWRNNLGATAQAGAIEDHVMLNNGVLTICGTLDADSVTIDIDSITIDGIGTINIDVASATEIKAHLFAGDDQVLVNPTITASLSIFGGEGNDLIEGGGGSNFLDGGEGDDILVGGVGAVNHLIGGNGNDTYEHNPDVALTYFYEGAGDDTYLLRDKENQPSSEVHLLPDPNSAPAGIDVLDFAYLNYGGVNVSLASDQLQDVQQSPSGLKVKIWQATDVEGGVDIENLIGSRFDDVLFGNELNNLIFGGEGDDEIGGGGGVDVLDGGTGYDVFVVDEVDDYLRDSFTDVDEVPLLRDILGNYNHVPHFAALPNHTVRAGEQISVTMTGFDVDGSELVYTLVGPTHGASLTANGEFSWTPSFDMPEHTELTFTVRMSDNGSPAAFVEQVLRVHVEPITIHVTATGFSNALSGDVAINWNPVSNADSYEIERRTASGEWASIGVTANTGWADWGLQLGRPYQYRVRAINSASEYSPFSIPVRVVAGELSDPSTANWSATLFSVTSQGVVTTLTEYSSVDYDNTEFAVLRLSDSTVGFEELFRGPLASFTSIGNDEYIYIDSTVVDSNRHYVYAVQEIYDDGRSPLTGRQWQVFVPLAGGSPPSGSTLPYALDIALLPSNVEGYGATERHEYEWSPDQERTGILFIPLNNNFDEQNRDADEGLVPDYVDDHVGGARIVADDSQVLAFQALAYGDLSSTATAETQVTLTFSPNVQVWYASGSQRLAIDSGVTYSLDEDFGRTPGTIITRLEFLVEGIVPSETFGDVSLQFEVVPAKAPQHVQLAELKATVGDLRPQVVTEVTVDEGQLFVFVPFVVGISEFDGEAVELRLVIAGNNKSTLASQTVVVENGSIATVFDLPSLGITGISDEYQVQVYYRGLEIGMDQFKPADQSTKVVAGAPATIELHTAEPEYVADGHRELTITATVRDKFGNLVEDGTPVSWGVDFGLGSIGDPHSPGAAATTNGTATITLLASDLQGTQRISAHAGVAQSELVLKAVAPSYWIDGVEQLDIDTEEVGVVTINDANVSDGTPVVWTISNGLIVGAAEEIIFETTIQNGTSSIQIKAAHGDLALARRGSAVVTANVAGKLETWELDFEMTQGFAVELERRVISGDVTANGQELLEYEQHTNPTFDGEPLWGFGPPVQEWPGAVSVGYYAETEVTIHGTPFETYYIDPSSTSQTTLRTYEALSTYATLHGLGPSNEIVLDATGRGTFVIRSNGSLGANQFRFGEFAVREGGPFVGQPERIERVQLVDHNWWTRTVDATTSFFGGDPETAAGVGGNVAGGVLIVGDVGSLVKNGYRATGFSDKEVNEIEAGLSALGLATELAVGVGEVADVPISSARALVAAARGTKFAEVIPILIHRAIKNGEDLASLGKFFTKVAFSEKIFQAAKQIFSSEDLMLAGVKAVERLGNDAANGFLDGLANIGRAFGTKVAQDVTQLVASLSDDAIDAFKQLDPAVMASVVDHLGVVLRSGKVSRAQLQKLLDNQALYTAAYPRHFMLVDLRIISDAEGLGKLVNTLASTTVENFAKGRVYELQAAARAVDANPGAKVTFVQKYAPEIDVETGKLLSSTDIDFILDDGINQVYYQAKSTAGAFNDLNDVRNWVSKARGDAHANGVSNQLIRYVTPDPNAVSTDILDWLVDAGIEIIDSPLFR